MAEHLDRSTKLLDFRLVVNRVCAHLPPMPPMEVPLIDQLRALPGHMECIIAKGVFHGGGMVLG